MEILAEFDRWGFEITSLWLFHADRAWIDATYRLEDGWTDDPQTVQFCFPLALADPTYRYDSPGAVLVAGPKADGGDDLPGANPELFAGQTFAAATSGSLKLPDGWTRAEACDALERPQRPLGVVEGRVLFSAEPRAILTIALCRR